MADGMSLRFPGRSLKETAKVVRTADKVLERQMKKGTKPIAKIAQDAIVRGIRLQRSGWAPLSPRTVKNKAGKGQDPRKLVAEGDLLSALESREAIQRTPKGHSVGIPRGATNREGKSLVMIGEVLEQGKTININGKLVTIPPRPFIAPVAAKINEVSPQIMSRRLLEGTRIFVRKIRGAK